MIKVNLHLAMAKAGIKKQTELARQARMTKSQLSLLFNEKAKGLTFKTLDKLCEALDCGVGDILEHIPNKR
jgi:putative transcriptional regulator